MQDIITIIDVVLITSKFFNDLVKIIFWENLRIKLSQTSSLFSSLVLIVMFSCGFVIVIEFILAIYFSSERKETSEIGLNCLYHQCSFIGHVFLFALGSSWKRNHGCHCDHLANGYSTCVPKCRLKTTM
jgi:hypothetical protein